MNLEQEKDISAYYRGLLIQKTIDIELRMDIVIGRFLSMNNQDRVLDLLEIFDIVEIGFYNKNRILQFIVKKHFLNFLKNKNSFFEDISYIMEKRNILAHRRPENEIESYVKLSWAKITKRKNSKASKFCLVKKGSRTYLMYLEDMCLAMERIVEYIHGYSFIKFK